MERSHIMQRGRGGGVCRYPAKAVAQLQSSPSLSDLKSTKSADPSLASVNRNWINKELPSLNLESEHDKGGDLEDDSNPLRMGLKLQQPLNDAVKFLT